MPRKKRDVGASRRIWIGVIVDVPRPFRAPKHLNPAIVLTAARRRARQSANIQIKGAGTQPVCLGGTLVAANVILASLSIGAGAVEPEPETGIYSSRYRGTEDAPYCYKFNGIVNPEFCECIDIVGIKIGL